MNDTELEKTGPGTCAEEVVRRLSLHRNRGSEAGFAMRTEPCQAKKRTRNTQKCKAGFLFRVICDTMSPAKS